MSRTTLDGIAARERAYRRDHFGCSRNESFLAASEGATTEELHDAMIDALALHQLTELAFDRRIRSLGANVDGRQGLGGTVRFGVAWCVAPYWTDHVHWSEDDQPSPAIEGWFCEAIDTFMPEALRVQVLGDVTVVLTDGNGYEVFETARRCDPPPWLLERKGSER